MKIRKQKAQLFLINGKWVTLRDIQRFTGVKYGTLYQRINKLGYPTNTGQAFRPVNKLHLHNNTSGDVMQAVF